MIELSSAFARLLAEAAELRAAGASWETVSTRVQQPVEECEAWPELHATAWPQLLAHARRQLLENAAGEAVTVLRQLLRSETELIRRDAAKLLLGAAPSPPAEAADLQGFIGDILKHVDAARVDTPA